MVGMRVYVQEEEFTKRNEEMFLRVGHAPNLIVVMVSQGYTYIRDLSKLMRAIYCITTIPQ